MSLPLARAGVRRRGKGEGRESWGREDSVLKLSLQAAVAGHTTASFLSGDCSIDEKGACVLIWQFRN